MSYTRKTCKEAHPDWGNASGFCEQQVHWYQHRGLVSEEITFATARAGYDFRVCSLCSCYIDDRLIDPHMQWHINLANVAKTANRADAWTRPIG